MKCTPVYLSCEYSNGLGDISKVTYTDEGGSLITAIEVLQSMLNAMAGFGFMRESIQDAVLSIAEDIKDVK